MHVVTVIHLLPGFHWVQQGQILAVHADHLPATVSGHSISEYDSVSKAGLVETKDGERRICFQFA